MVARPTPPEKNRRARGRPMLWLFAGLIFFAVLAGLVLGLDWMDPESSSRF